MHEDPRIPEARAAIRAIDAQLAGIDARRDHVRLTNLTTRRAHLAEFLTRAGHHVPPPVIAW